MLKIHVDWHNLQISLHFFYIHNDHTGGFCIFVTLWATLPKSQTIFSQNQLFFFFHVPHAVLFVVVVWVYVGIDDLISPHK